MKIFKNILKLLLVVIVGILGYVLIKDGSYQITERRTIAAPVDIVYNQIVDLAKWQDWNSWMLNPDIKSEFPGNTVGRGAYFTSSDEYGKGTFTVKQIKENELVMADMVYKSNFGESQSKIKFMLAPKSPGSTEVIWTLEGKQGFMEKLMSLLMGMDMEKMIRPEYQKSLKNLEDIAIKEMNSFSIGEPQLTAVTEQYYLALPADTSTEMLNDVYEDLSKNLKNYALENNLVTTGAPIIFYDEIDQDYNSMKIRVAIPVPVCPDLVETSDLICTVRAEGSVLTTGISGNSEYKRKLWERTDQFIREKQLNRSSGKPYETRENGVSMLHIPVIQN